MKAAKVDDSGPAQLDLLKKQDASRDSIAHAEQDVKAAPDRIEAADLKLQFLNQLIKLRETERKAAEAHVLTAEALVEQSKLRAMKAGNAPQAAAVNAGEIDERVAKARAREAELQKESAAQRIAAVDLYNRWEQTDASARALSRPSTIPVPPPVSEPTPH